MLQQLEEILANALKQLEGTDNSKDLESWRVQYLGKKSSLTVILRGLSTLPLDERKAAGARANQVKTLLEDNLKEKEQALRATQLAADTAGEAIDITLPGRQLPAGHLHPITQTLEEICDIFYSMGFQIMEAIRLMLVREVAGNLPPVKEWTIQGGRLGLYAVKKSWLQAAAGRRP